MTTFESLTIISQTVLRMNFARADQIPTRDEISAAVDKCAPLLGADLEAQLAAMTELQRRYGHDTNIIWR
jgi:hypothetical protein